jgi:hypothetical protein
MLPQSTTSPKPCPCGCGHPRTTSYVLHQNRLGIPLDESFWNKVDRSGGTESCWPWVGGRNPNWYGYWYPIVKYGLTVYAHRTAWEWDNGPIPKGLIACHHCDNPPCCNPNHIFIGTDADNLADMHRKGRAVSGFLRASRGEKNGNSRLNADTVSLIRLRWRNGELIQHLADEHGVTWRSVQLIVLNRTWKTS